MTFTVGNGRRGYQVARPRSNGWLWTLNAVVITAVVVAGAAVMTSIGHTVVLASYNFLLFYMGVLALIALTAEVGIGLVATDRIFMKPAGRVTMQAVHRAVGFGSIAFLVAHIILEIIAGRASALDSVIPFLYKHKTFYLGIGTLASDMFIMIMALGVYRARLATRMSPRGWRLLHATAYIAWIFGLIHGLLGGRPAKPFFGYEGFVYWSYGFCVAAVALALVVRFVAKDRARSEMVEQPVAETPASANMAAVAALATGGLGSGSGLPGAGIHAVPSGRQLSLDGRPATPGQPARRQLALPAGSSDAGARRTGTFQPTARYDWGSPFDQLGMDHPSAPLPQLPADHPSAPLPRVTGYEPPAQLSGAARTGLGRPRGQGDWAAAFERPMGVRRAGPAPRYERTGEIDLDRSGPQQPVTGPGSGARASFRPDDTDPYGQAAMYGRSDSRPAQHGQLTEGPQYGSQASYRRHEQAAAWSGPASHQASGGYEGPYPGGPARPDGYPGHAAQYPEPAGYPPAGRHPYPAGSGGSAGHAQHGPDGYAPPRGYRPPGGSGSYPAQPGGSGSYPVQPGDSGSFPAHTGGYGSYAAESGGSGGYAAQPGGPAGYPQPPRDLGHYPAPGGYAAPGGPSHPAGYGPPGGYDERDRYGRSERFDQERAAHYASFAEQDAAYTRPRPPAARDPYDPQDETDPLNIVTLNTGDRW